MHPGSFVSTRSARAAAVAVALAVLWPAAASADTTTTSSTTSTSTTTTVAQPTAATGAASGVTYATAVLNGTVNANGNATTYFFQYGKSTTYGVQTATQSAGAGTGNVVATAAISGLAPSTVYHFRVVAVNGAGTVNGVDQTFTTPVTPAPGPVTGGSKSVTSNSATVTGTVKPNGVPTTYQFQYGKTAAYGSHTATTSAGSGTAAIAVSASIGGLAASTTYHYRLVATSAGGVVVGGDHTFKTGTAPKAGVTTGTATTISSSTAVLTGEVFPDGQAADYYFQYGLTTGYSAHTAVQSAGAGTKVVAVSAPIGGLAPVTKYHFRLVVVGVGGTIAGSDHTFTTTSVPLSIGATITPNPARVGGSATITGNVTGTGAAGRQVVLQSTPFPYFAPFTNVGNAEVVAANGTFTFAVTGLAVNTEYRVVTVGSPAAASGAFREGVAVRVSFGASAKRTAHGLKVRVAGSIAPAAGDVRASLQKLVGRRWVSTAKLTLKVASGTLLRYTRTLHLAKGGRYRVLVRVTDGARLSAVSRTLNIKRPRE